MVKIFLTGATGWIGRHILPELLARGHTVTALSRSEASDAKIKAAGATPLRGSLTDLEALKAGATGADAVIHTAFIHDFTSPDFDMARNVAIDGAAVSALASGLKKGGIFINSAGTLGISHGQLITENDHVESRSRSSHFDELKALGLVPMIIRLSPTVHGTGDQGFVPLLINIAKQKGCVGVIEDGATRWPAVHVTDAAKVFALALDKGEEGFYHATADQGIPTKTFLKIIADRLSLPMKTLTKEEAAEHYGFFAFVMNLDTIVSDKITRDKLGYVPAGPGLLEDLETSETYFA